MNSILAQVTSLPKKAAAHVVERRGRYGIAAGFIAGIGAMHALDIVRINEWNGFLEENDLTEKFYTPETV